MCRGMKVAWKALNLLVQIVCWALLGVLAAWVVVRVDSAPINRTSTEATDRAAMVAAAQKYDAAMEAYGDRQTADALAQKVYKELGGTRDYWQGVAGE